MCIKEEIKLSPYKAMEDTNGWYVGREQWNEDAKEWVFYCRSSFYMTKEKLDQVFKPDVLTI